MTGEPPWRVPGSTFAPGTHLQIMMWGVVDDEGRTVLLHGVSGECLQLAWLGSVGATLIATRPPPATQTEVTQA